MKISSVTTFTAFALLAAVAAAASAAAPSAPAGQGQLKWTPHRAATAAPAEDVAATPPTPATPAPAPAAPPQVAAAPTAPAGAPATVQLPPGVPPVVPSVDPGPSFAPLRASRDLRPSLDRLAAPVRRMFDPVNPDGLFAVELTRAPQGPMKRPILADERPQPPRTASTDRLGGGLAPRFTPGGSRPERLAANVDAIPSVMAKAAQADALPATPEPAPAAAPSVPEAIAVPAPTADLQMPTTETIVMEPGIEGMPVGEPSLDDGMMLGGYPAEMHVESFYDDPYACEDDESLMPMCNHSGRICGWLRQFGKPYYGWRWYRDFTASAGITAFTNPSDLGIHGNFGTNEYINFAMPFWNAFGVGWQIGARGTQTNFQSVEVDTPQGTLGKNGRDQVFVTTGFFTRAFEGRGLQGGAVYDYLHDNWADNVDVQQIRGEVSYVWGYHELGFWGAANVGDNGNLVFPSNDDPGVASTIDLYTAFYRLQFGDANEWKFWGGATGNGDGIIGSIVRAPMSRSLALEGTFTYLIPKGPQTVPLDTIDSSVTFSPNAWNVGVNLVYYPAGRARRSLASPYRPLFDVADNGSMIRSVSP